MAKSRPKYRVLVGMVVGPINVVCRVDDEIYVVQDEPIPEYSGQQRAELICKALNAIESAPTPKEQ